MKYYYFLLLLFLSACTLSAEQEVSLNNAMATYVNSINSGQAMPYVAFTHPNAVAYYKNQSDSIFKSRFDLSDEEGSSFLQDGNIMDTKSEENIIHVKYEFLEVDSYYTKPNKKIIYAISDDDGISWFFIDEEDYQNDAIITSTNRLIK